MLDLLEAAKLDAQSSSQTTEESKQKTRAQTTGGTPLIKSLATRTESSQAYFDAVSEDARSQITEIQQLIEGEVSTFDDFLEMKDQLVAVVAKNAPNLAEHAENIVRKAAGKLLFQELVADFAETDYLGRPLAEDGIFNKLVLYQRTFPRSGGWEEEDPLIKKVREELITPRFSEIKGKIAEDAEVDFKQIEDVAQLHQTCKSLIHKAFDWTVNGIIDFPQYEDVKQELNSLKEERVKEIENSE